MHSPSTSKEMNAPNSQNTNIAFGKHGIFSLVYKTFHAKLDAENDVSVKLNALKSRSRNKQDESQIRPELVRVMYVRTHRNLRYLPFEPSVEVCNSFFLLLVEDIFGRHIWTDKRSY